MEAEGDSVVVAMGGGATVVEAMKMNGVAARTTAVRQKLRRRRRRRRQWRRQRWRRGRGRDGEGEGGSGDAVVEAMATHGSRGGGVVVLNGYDEAKREVTAVMEAEVGR